MQLSPTQLLNLLILFRLTFNVWTIHPQPKLCFWLPQGALRVWQMASHPKAYPTPVGSLDLLFYMWTHTHTIYDKLSLIHLLPHTLQVGTCGIAALKGVWIAQCSAMENIQGLLSPHSFSIARHQQVSSTVSKPGHFYGRQGTLWASPPHITLYDLRGAKTV